MHTRGLRAEEPRLGPGPLSGSLAAAECHISARAALPGSLGGWRELALRAGAGPGLREWQTDRPMGDGRGAAAANELAAAEISCGAREPDEAHLDSCAGERCSPAAGAQRQLSTSPTSSPSGRLLIHFPKEAIKVPSVKLSPPILCETGPDPIQHVG